MDGQEFIDLVKSKAEELSINPILLLSAIEGLYTFKDVALTEHVYELLDSLILSVFALRIGDEFHSLAEAHLMSEQASKMEAAAEELRILKKEDIDASDNHYLHAFARVIDSKTNIRMYHIKALEVAAMEIRKTQLQFGNSSIGAIALYVCQNHLAGSVDLSSLFRQ
ncbi:MAG: hypothetical protein WKF70_04550 [Chitinophagaceae bacterium]